MRDLYVVNFRLESRERSERIRMSDIFEIADRYVERVAELSPFSATYMGVPGHEHEMDDFSPEGSEAEAALNRATLSELASAPIQSDRDRVARDAMVDSLGLNLERHDADEHLRSLSMIHSPVHSVRQIFDMMPRDTEEHWANIASRMALVTRGLDSYRRTLDEGLRRGLVVAKRQAVETADQCDVWNGTTRGHTSFFQGLVEAFDETELQSAGLQTDLAAAAQTADRAVAEMALYLRETYATVSSSTYGRRTGGAGSNSHGSILRWRIPQSGSRRDAGSRGRRSCSTTIRRGRSRARSRSSSGCRSCRRAR